MMIPALSNLQWAPFTRELRQPFRTAAYSWSHRQGILLRATLSAGSTLVTEASPLLGYSRESVTQVEETLRGETYRSLLDLAYESALAPSLQFAIESFALGPWPAGVFVRSNAVLGLNADADSVRGLQEAAYKSIKIKISPERVPALKNILSTIDPTCKIRLDANGSFTASAWAALDKELDPAQVEYCEDPVPWEQRHLGKGKIPIAWDQGLNHWDQVVEALGSSTCSVVILKPSVLGGFGISAALIELVTKAQKTFTITSALEVEPARRALLQFIAGQAPQNCAGISTGYLFRENFLADSALWANLPAVSAQEQLWWQALPWREIA